MLHFEVKRMLQASDTACDDLHKARIPSVPNRGMFPMFPRPKKVFPVPEVFPSDGVFPCSLFPIGTQSMPVPDGKMRVPNG